MFAGEGPAVFDDELGRVPHEGGQTLRPTWALEPEANAHMDAALTEMPVCRSAQVVLAEQHAHPREVVGKPAWRDDGVFQAGIGRRAVW
jgi:hypothetical protein